MSQGTKKSEARADSGQDTEYRLEEGSVALRRSRGKSTNAHHAPR